VFTKVCGAGGKGEKEGGHKKMKHAYPRRLVTLIGNRTHGRSSEKDGYDWDFFDERRGATPERGRPHLTERSRRSAGMVEKKTEPEDLWGKKKPVHRR